jgi:peptidoglycan/xylan/chitin deacetylase (PgdA/CDA1 family)
METGNGKYGLFTNDVETTSIWHNKLRSETGWKVYREGMPRLLDLYKKHDVKSTFFFNCDIAKLIPDIVRMVLADGHEVGSHGLSHKDEDAFDLMSYAKQVTHLSESKKILEDITGEQVISFRAPALRITKDIGIALLETGYLIDSSVASQRFDMGLSGGSKSKLWWFVSPRKAYHTDVNNIFRKGTSALVEVPVSSLIFPYAGTTMRIFPKSLLLLRNLLKIENQFTKKPIVFLIHPNELIDESDEATAINRRSKGMVSHYMKDIIRTKLKRKNLGEKSVPLYEQHIAYFKARNFKCITIKHYCQEMKLVP